MTETRRRHGATALAALLPRITGKALRERGFAEDAIIARWPDIVGAEIARDAQPDHIRFPRGKRDGGVLHLRVDGAAALEIQHEGPRIIERVNAFFGYPAIARLALVQGPLPRRETRPEKRAPRPLSAEETATLDRAIGGIENETLRESLSKLGRAIRGRRETR